MMTFDDFKMSIYNNPDKLAALRQLTAKKCNTTIDVIASAVDTACITRERDKAEALGHFSSIGGTALKVGSVKVSTINFARIAYESGKDEKKFLEILKDRINVNLMALDVVRDIIKKNVQRGLLPNFNEGMLDFDHLYNTCGINGIYETMKYFGYTETDEFGYTKYKPEAFAFGEKILRYCQEVSKEFAADKDYRVNWEQVPAESAATKFQEADTLLYPNCVVKDLPLYSNQWLGLGIKATLKDRIEICSKFDTYCNGGSIMHVNVDAPFATDQQAWDMLNYITDKGVTYFAFNGKLSTDDNGHLFYGDVCPECGARKTAEYTRTVGFYTKTANWSKERKEEFKLRKWMNLNDQGINAR